MSGPARGEIWMVDLEPVRGHEQGGKRPALVVSADLFNESPADLVVILPITSQAKGVRSHLPIRPPEGGIRRLSFIKCEDIRSIAKERLSKRWGSVSRQTMDAVADCLRILLEI